MALLYNTPGFNPQHKKREGEGEGEEGRKKERKQSRTRENIGINPLYKVWAKDLSET